MIGDLLEKDEHYDDGSYGPVLVRLAWHASGSYDKGEAQTPARVISGLAHARRAGWQALVAILLRVGKCVGWLTRLLLTFTLPVQPVIQLLTHATVCAASNTGGSNGATMRFNPEKQHSANAGLHIAQDFLEPVKKVSRNFWAHVPSCWTFSSAAYA